MRTREEIIHDVNTHPSFGIIGNLGYVTQKNLEVLLDIRDLLLEVLKRGDGETF